MLLRTVLTGDGASLGAFPLCSARAAGSATIASHTELSRSPLTGKLASVPAPQPSVLWIPRHEALLSCPKATSSAHIPPSEMAMVDIFLLQDFEGTDINIMIII